MNMDSMERAKSIVGLSPYDAMKVEQVKVNPHSPQKEMSFFEDFSLLGIQIRRIQPGLIICSLKVPPRLIDRDGNLSSGAIATLVDNIGASSLFAQTQVQTMNFSVNLSVSFMAAAKLGDELEVTAKLMGKKGDIVDTHVVIVKDNGEIVAEGRTQLLCKQASKL